MKKIIIVGVLILLLLGGSLWAFITYKKNHPASKTNETATTTVSTTVVDPLDVTLDFYNTWLTALKSTSTNPYTANLLARTEISSGVRSSVEQKHTSMKTGDRDPVLCQTKIPSRVGAKIVYNDNNKAEVLVLSRGDVVKSAFQSLVTLQAINGTWQIQKIECSEGETAAASEFDFEQSGNLLKESAKTPLDSKNLYLVFENDGQKGNAVQLFFDDKSMCSATDGSQAICDPAKLTEGTKVYIQAAMTEEGAVVKKLTPQ
jgi:multisubunit Na+/H+ antiporter MnhG subunit